MTFVGITIGIAVAVIALVVYSALVVSSRQDRLAERLREENSFKRAPYRSYSADSFAFETSDELMEDDEFEEDLIDSENHFL